MSFAMRNDGMSFAMRNDGMSFAMRNIFPFPILHLNKSRLSKTALFAIISAANKAIETAEKRGQRIPARLKNRY